MFAQCIVPFQTQVADLSAAPAPAHRGTFILFPHPFLISQLPLQEHRTQTPEIILQYCEAHPHLIRSRNNGQSMTILLCNAICASQCPQAYCCRKQIIHGPVLKIPCGSKGNGMLMCMQEGMSTFSCCCSNEAPPLVKHVHSILTLAAFCNLSPDSPTQMFSTSLATRISRI